MIKAAKITFMEVKAEEWTTNKQQFLTIERNKPGTCY